MSGLCATAMMVSGAGGVDTFSRFSPVIDPRFTYRGEDVVATPERACRSVGYPKTVRADQGSEFISRDLDLWAYQRGVELDFSRPGKPTDKAFIESFDGKFRSECLNAHWFLTPDGARSKMEEWRKAYNAVRPCFGGPTGLRMHACVRSKEALIRAVIGASCELLDTRRFARLRMTSVSERQDRSWLWHS